MKILYYSVKISILFFSGSNRVEDAIECYQRAANMFKMAKNWSKAGEAFCEAATLHGRAGSKHDAATMYVDASNCFKKVSDFLNFFMSMIINVYFTV